MNARALTSMLAVSACAAALAPSRAAAFDWSGRLGLIYTRDDTWSAGGQRLTMPHLDLYTGLTASGSVVQRGVLDYAGSVDYRRATYTRPGEGESVRNTLNYRANTGLFNHAASPLALRLHAAQQEDDLASGAANAGKVGSVARSYGGDFRTAAPGRPTLSGGYMRTETATTLPGIPDLRRTSDAVRGLAMHGGSNFSSIVQYRGNFNDGSDPADRYADHQVDVDATATLAPKSEIQISDRYSRRDPHEISGFNPRQELNMTSASLSYRPTLADFHLGTYLYTHAIQEVPRSVDPVSGEPVSEDVERTLHRASYRVQREVAEKEWLLRGEVDGTASIDRVGTSEIRTLGQTVGTLATWRPVRGTERQIELRAGPSFGVLEPEGSKAQFGYGGTAGASWSRTRSTVRTAMLYDVTYANDLGVEGWSFRQNGTGTVEAAVGTARVNGMLTLSGERRESPLLGPGGSRSALLSAGWSTSRSNVTASLGYSAGLTNPVANPGIGDGLFLALPYDTHTLTGALSASTRLMSHLVLGASARLSSAVAPGRPDRDEREVRAKIEYNIGALRVALEDRYYVVESRGNAFRFNELLVNAYRTFGSW